MTSSDPLAISHQHDTLTLTLNRPEIHNAFDDGLIQTLIDALEMAATRTDTRFVILTGAGRSFSAGADLGWMKRMRDACEQDNLSDSLKLAELMRCLAFHPKTTIARVNGAAFGGGVGLVACCDLAVAVDSARFGLTEARLGLLPAVISPYVVEAMGLRQASRYFRTAERFDAQTAEQLGLIHRCVVEPALDDGVNGLIEQMRRNGPVAVGQVKPLLQLIGGRTESDQQQMDLATARLISRLRVAPEGQEGLAAFLDKRTPEWPPEELT